MLAMGQPGYTRDVDAAREWFRKASAQGYAPSQAFYGALLMREIGPEWIELGLELVRKSAAQNDAQGQFFLARCYENGHGVARNDVTAAALFEKAALGGSKPAQQSIAAMYERGQGVASDPVKAAKWRQIADKPVPAPRCPLARRRGGYPRRPRTSLLRASSWPSDHPLRQTAPGATRALIPARYGKESNSAVSAFSL
ncbi:tetratricopeptide repeat protein [Massilia violaceinigra]